MSHSPKSLWPVTWYVLSKKGKIRALVVDDHAGVREGLIAVVNAQPDMMVVGEAGDGRKAIELFQSLKPDVSLLDWNLPIVGGEEVLATLRAGFPEARFIVITAMNEVESIRQALRLGAKAYLHKDMLRRELLPAIRAVHSGQKYLPKAIIDQIEKAP